MNIEIGSYVRSYVGRGFDSYVEGVVVDSKDNEYQLLTMYDVVQGEVQDVWMGETITVSKIDSYQLHRPFWEPRVGVAMDCFMEAVEEKYETQSCS